jgi:SAM-dependent methyltransferase
MNSSFYGEDYFERGVETQVSNYSNYHWEPELTIPMAMTMIDLLGIKRHKSVLDFGCAKGYLVKALRLLYRESWGVDISEYALSKVDPMVKDYCFPVEGTWAKMDSKWYDRDYYEQGYDYDFCIAKDVFEHIPVHELKAILENLKVKTLFAIIPLGSEGKYFAEVNNFDKSHVICEPADWWIDFIGKAGWVSDFFSYQVEGIKDTYRNIPKAHGFFIHRRG